MEYGGRWKPLHYTVKRTFAPVALSWYSANQSGVNTGFLSVVSDLTSEVVLDYTIVIVKTDGSAGYEVSSGSASIKAGSSQSLFDMNIEQNGFLPLYNDCTIQTCILKASGSIKGQELNVYDSFLFLDQVKNLYLESNVEITTTSFVQTSANQVSFKVQVSDLSPFLFMELADKEVKDSFDIVYGSNAGWFSDNNFLAEAGRIYEITYTSFSSPITVDEFKVRLFTRVLQTIYDSDLDKD